ETSRVIGEDLPGISLIRQGGLRLLHETRQPVVTDLPQELLLAAVAGIESTDADAGMLGHGGDRGAGIGDEHRARGLADALVVAGGFRPAPAQWRGSVCLHHEIVDRYRMEQSVPQ